MIGSQQEIFSVLRQSNPWWGGGQPADLPSWHRAAFPELLLWVDRPPAPRSVLLTGARQVGKTTLLLQVVRRLLADGCDPQNIIYVSLDHPLLKLSGLDRVLAVWEESRPSPEGPQFLFIDEIQNAPDWSVWLKHQTDFRKHRRITVTGSAIPLSRGEESGVGRLHTIKLPTLSFGEFLRLRNDTIPELPDVRSLADAFEWDNTTRIRIGEEALGLTPLFHEYLLRGGFPQAATVESLTIAQRLLREDIVDRVLKRDMTATFGIRRVVELETLFLYLCQNDGGIINVTTLSQRIGISSSTVHNYISHLESAHLVYQLPQLSRGKTALRNRPKIYLADPAIPGSVLLKERTLLQDPTSLGHAVEAAFFKHVFTHYYRLNVRFHYWQRSRTQYEVDLVASLPSLTVPFEVKYSEAPIGCKQLRGLRALIDESGDINRGYMIAKGPCFEVRDPSGALMVQSVNPEQPLILCLPAALACYWLSMIELNQQRQYAKASPP